MKKVGVTVVFGGILLGTLAAHAAPTKSQPAPSIVRAPSQPIVALGKVTAEVVPMIANTCGQPQKVHVKLVNTTPQPWSGVINFVPTMKPVSLGPKGTDGATQLHIVEANVLDCTKPLSPQALRVWKTGAETTPILVKSLKPKTVSSVVGYKMPPDMSRPWVRRAEFQATCDGPVNARVHVQGGNQPMPVQLKLTFGSYVSSPNVTVAPNQPTIVPAIVPKPLDCSSRPPSFAYELVSPPGQPNTLEPQEVMYE